MDRYACEFTVDIVDTPDSQMTQTDAARQMIERGTQPNHCPTARPGAPEEMADVITFLLSEKASYVNGTTWQADGGLMCK